MKRSPREEFDALHRSIVVILNSWGCEPPKEYDPQSEALGKIVQALRWADDEIFRLDRELRRAAKIADGEKEAP